VKENKMKECKLEKKFKRGVRGEKEGEGKRIMKSLAVVNSPQLAPKHPLRCLLALPLPLSWTGEKTEEGE